MRRGQVLFAVLLFCAAFITAALRIEAQVLYGSVVGTVTDSSNNAVPQATVRITDTRTNQTRETQTNDLGTYNFPSLPAGSYDIFA
jgi:carboxypeptidase family protein